MKQEISKEKEDNTGEDDKRFRIKERHTVRSMRQKCISHDEIYINNKKIPRLFAGFF